VKKQQHPAQVDKTGIGEFISDIADFDVCDPVAYCIYEKNNS